MKTLMIVDDSRIFQKVVERTLSPYYQIVGKGNSGIEGFDLYQKLQPDLVVMDITMPNCSGKECLQKIIEYDPYAQIIMVSSLGDENTVHECLALGAKAYVCKDQISSNDTADSTLVRIIRKVVDQANMKNLEAV